MATVEYIQITATYTCGHTLSMSTKPEEAAAAVQVRQGKRCPDCRDYPVVTRFKVGSWGGRR